MSAPVDFVPGSFPPNYCPATYQQLYNDMIALLTGSIPGNFTFVNYGPTTPDADDQDKPWIRTGAMGEPDRTYNYFSGSWAALNPTPASGSERRLWTGPLTGVGGLDTYDGGSVGAVTATSGPMWEEDTNFAGKVPVGVGTLSPSGTVLAVGDTGGVDQVTQTIAQLAAHSHGPDTVTDPTATSIVQNTSGATGQGTSAGGTFNINAPTTGITGASDPMNTMPPYRTVYFIKRTARIYYVI